MPHFKCVACKTRLRREGGAPDGVGDLCPGCGSLLEPVGELAEIVGFRSMKPRDSSSADGASGTHLRLAHAIGDLTALRAAIDAQARLDAGRSVDDGGGFAAEAIPLPRPDTT